MKIALIDLETTGLDPAKHEIIEIGAVIFESHTHEVFHTVSIRVRPERIKDADPEALAVNGYTPSAWRSASDLGWALTALSMATKDCTFMSYNAMFDWSFLVLAAKRAGVQFSFQRAKIDLLSLAWGRIPHYRVASWSLKTVCAYLGLKPENKVHRALEGAEKAFEVYQALRRMPAV